MSLDDGRGKRFICFWKMAGGKRSSRPPGSARFRDWPATDSAGVPLADAVVSVRSAATIEPIALTMLTKDGRFTLQGVSRGEWQLRLAHPRFKGRSIEISVNDSGDAVDGFWGLPRCCRTARTARTASKL